MLSNWTKYPKNKIPVQQVNPRAFDVCKIAALAPLSAYSVSSRLQAIEASDLATYVGSYCSEQEQAELLEYMQAARFDTFAGGQAFWGQGDGENTQKAIYSKNIKANPSRRADEKNEEELTKEINDPNSLYSQYMIDNGTASFKFDPTSKSGTSREIVQAANEAFAARRDRFRVPPPKGDQMSEEDIKKFFETASMHEGAEPPRYSDLYTHRAPKKDAGPIPDSDEEYSDEEEYFSPIKPADPLKPDGGGTIGGGGYRSIRGT